MNFSVFCRRAVQVAFAALLLPLSTAASADEWPQLGFDAQHTYFNPNEAVLDRKNVSKLVQLWHNPDQGSQYVQADGLVVGCRYSASPSPVTLGLIDASSGMQVASNSDVPGRDCQVPLLGGDNIYLYTRHLRSRGGYLTALDQKTTQIRWTSAVDGGISAFFRPVYSDGSVYVPEFKKFVSAFDAKTGDLRWRTFVGHRWDMGVIVADGRVFVTSSHVAGQGEDAVTALDATTGAVLWRRNEPWLSPAGGLATSGLVIVRVHLQDADGQTRHLLRALDQATGELRWERVSNGFSLAAGYGVLVAATDYGIEALDAPTGRLLWSTSNGTAEQASNLVLANGVVYYLTYKALHPNPMVRLVTLDARNGRTIEQDQPVRFKGEQWYKQLMVVDGRVMIRGDEGQLTTFGLAP